MARDFAGDPKDIRDHSTQVITRLLGLEIESWNEVEKSALEDLSLVLAAIPGVSRWSSPEKELAARIIRAKASGEEALYLKLMQKHASLRDALIGLGSK